MGSRIRPTDLFSLLQIEAQNGQKPWHAVVGGSNGSESLFVCRAPGGGREASRPGQLGGQGCSTVIPGGGIGNVQLLVNLIFILSLGGASKLFACKKSSFRSQFAKNVIFIGFKL